MADPRSRAGRDDPSAAATASSRGPRPGAPGCTIRSSRGSITVIPTPSPFQAGPQPIVVGGGSGQVGHDTIGRESQSGP